MSILHNIAHVVGRFVFDKPAREMSLSELAEKVESAGQKIEQLLETCADTYANYDVLAHIIGIERWGIRRLRVVLGEPFIEDEYDTYRPSIALFWKDLILEFQKTRQEFLALIAELEQAGVDETTAVKHNELGIMTVQGWIRYLDMHANLEVKKLLPKAEASKS